MRRTIWLSVVLPLVMGFLGALLAQTLALPTVVDAQDARIRAERFTVVGDNGADRVRLQTGPGIAARLLVLDAEGAPRATIGTGGADGDLPLATAIFLNTSDGTQVGRLGVGAEGEGTVALHLRDRAGRDRVLLRVADDGTPSIQILDAAGAVTWSAR
jgi:hypothetical protein